MRKLFFFFHIRVLRNEDKEIAPVYATSVSEVEDHLERQGVEIVEMWKETLENNQVYPGYFKGFEYRYGFLLDGDVLVFLFTLPASLKRLSYYPVKVRRKIEEKLPKGFITRRFEPLEVVQFAELIDGQLYVATEW